MDDSARPLLRLRWLAAGSSSLVAVLLSRALLAEIAGQLRQDLVLLEQATNGNFDNSRDGLLPRRDAPDSRRVETEIDGIFSAPMLPPVHPDADALELLWGQSSTSTQMAKFRNKAAISSLPRVLRTMATRTTSGGE